MSYVIHVRDKKRDMWFTWCGAVNSEKEAIAFGTAKQAESIMELCGLYRLMGRVMTVKKSSLEPNVPGPGSHFTYEMPNRSAMRPAPARGKPAKAKRAKSKQLDLFGE